MAGRLATCRRAATAAPPGDSGGRALLPAPAGGLDDAQAAAGLQDIGGGSFTQSYGRPELDASLLRLPLVGFLPADDPRVRGTVAAIERELLEDGLVLRYRPSAELEGM